MNIEANQNVNLNKTNTLNTSCSFLHLVYKQSALLHLHVYKHKVDLWPHISGVLPNCQFDTAKRRTSKHRRAHAHTHSLPHRSVPYARARTMSTPPSPPPPLLSEDGASGKLNHSAFLCALFAVCFSMCFSVCSVRARVALRLLCRCISLASTACVFRSTSKHSKDCINTLIC